MKTNRRNLLQWLLALPALAASYWARAGEKSAADNLPTIDVDRSVVANIWPPPPLEPFIRGVYHHEIDLETRRRHELYIRKTEHGGLIYVDGSLPGDVPARPDWEGWTSVLIGGLSVADLERLPYLAVFNKGTNWIEFYEWRQERGWKRVFPESITDLHGLLWRLIPSRDRFA